MAAEDNFEITINGVGCHAAMPHLGKDPIVASFFDLVAGIETPARVEMIDKIDDLEADCVPNG